MFRHRLCEVFSCSKRQEPLRYLVSWTLLKTALPTTAALNSLARRGIEGCGITIDVLISSRRKPWKGPHFGKGPDWTRAG